MGIDTYVELNSWITNQASFVSNLGEKLLACSSEIGGTALELSSFAGSKAVTIASHVFADEVAKPLRYEEVKTITKPVGTDYNITKPPNQRV